MAQQKRLSKALNFWNTHITHIDSFLHSKDLGLSSSAMSFHTTVSSKNSFQKKSGFVGCFAAIPRVRPSDMHSQAMPHRRSRSNGICDRTLSTFYILLCGNKARVQFLGRQHWDPPFPGLSTKPFHHQLGTFLTHWIGKASAWMLCKRAAIWPRHAVP